MKYKKIWIAALAASFFLFSFSKTVFTQAAPRTREMEQAVRLYQEGKDNDAMDRFMDILIKGTPSEKALANEYISKITLRMNTGIATTDDKGPDSSVADSSDQGKTVTSTAPEKKYVTEKYVDNNQIKETEPAGDRDLIISKIYKRMEDMKRDAILAISKVKSFKLFMKDSSTPVGILVNNNEIFSSATSFKPQALNDLQLLSSLLFTLGKAQIMIVPKGGVTGEIEIASIRRAIAINSYLVSRGIAPGRINVNLTGTNVTLPKEINNADGTLCVLDYTGNPVLKSENDSKTGGPKVSMGIYPTSIAAYNNEGAIIEFSVSEGSGGMPTWKFQIYQVLSDNSMIIIQELNGEGAKYNQTYFNGREKFFGAPYPWGKYVFSVTARDLSGKETTEKRLLFLKPSPEEEKQAVKKSNNGKELNTASSPRKGRNSSVIKKSSASLKKAASIKAASAKSKKAAAKKTAPAASGDEDESNNSQVTYKIYFTQGTMKITPNSEKKLEQVAKNFESYPDTKIMVTGYAYKKEVNSKVLAKKRADAVKKELVDKYEVKASKIKTVSLVSKTLKTIVEVKMVQ